MQHLCSRTLKPSLTESFVDKWTSSLEDFRVSHSQVLESVKLLKTPDTCFHTSQTESESANLEFAFSKTYKESSPAKQETENPFSNMSSESWKKWVTEQRQEYSRRKKSAHLTRESESSSSVWRTPQSQEPGISTERLEGQLDGSRAYHKETGRLAQYGLTQQVQKKWPTATVFDTTGGSYPTQMVNGVYKSKHSQEPSSPWYGAKLKDAVETHEENWPTPTIAEVSGGMRLDQIKSGKWNNIQLREKIALLEEEKHKNWPTASARDWKDTAGMSKERDGKALGRVDQLPRAVYHQDGLQDQANLNTNGKNQESWPTPRANKVHPQITEENREHLANRNKANLEEDIAGHCGKATGKLNPNWVEQLMGLPVGWTQL